MHNIIKPNCFERKCKHFLGIYQPDEESEAGQTVNCKAFPVGIPHDIAYGDNKHLVKFPGQENDIVYERL
jgi:hypothetical protein